MRVTRSRILTTLLVLVALFTGSFIAEHIPSADELLRDKPFLRAGVVGRPVSLRTADVTITAVHAAKQVTLHGQVAESAGVWLVVDVVWAPRREQGELAGSRPVVETADGRRFGGLQAVLNTCGPAQPGLPVKCQLPFEVAIDALEGAHLLVPAGTSVETADDVADIDLGIDIAAAEDMAASGDQIALLQTSTVSR